MLSSTRSCVILIAVMLGIGGPGVALSQSSSPATMAVDSTHGLLRPGDVIRLRIWREPDLSGDFPVDETGTATFPKIGAFKVFDYTPSGLKTKLLESYAKYLVNPSVEVTMLRRTNSLCAAQHHSHYPVAPTNNIAAAIASTSGVTPITDQLHLIL